MSNMIYDIRTSECAKRTLVNLTNVPICVWQKYLGKENQYDYDDYMVKEVIDSFGCIPNNYKDFKFIYFHVTTSNNECLSFKKHGILDLKQSYMCQDSELRNFLEENNIRINLNERTLVYNDKIFDISYRSSFSAHEDTKEHRCWSIGRKFYYDYATCGFLSVCDKEPYQGQVHHRPEILMNIDNLLDLRLSQEWAKTHIPYEVVAKVNGENIVYSGDDKNSDEEKVLHYLTKAFRTAFYESNEEILLIKNSIQIPPDDIIEIKPLECWK